MRCVPSRIASEILGVHPNTLREWADSGRIDHFKTAAGQRRYAVESYLKEGTDSHTACYCRVSFYKQKDDLDRQVAFMKENYPDAEIIKDIGSGINFKRKGLRSILERALRGDKLRVVAARRDRLARFGHDLIKWLIERSGGELLVLKESGLSPEQELTQDLLTILHVFSCGMHGLRSYKNQIGAALSDPGAEAHLQAVD